MDPTLSGQVAPPLQGAAAAGLVSSPPSFPCPLPAYLAPVRATTRATGAAAVIIDKYPTVTCLALTFVTVLPWDLRRSNQGNAARCGDRGRGA